MFSWSEETFIKKQLKYRIKTDKIIEYLHKNRKFPEFIENQEIENILKINKLEVGMNERKGIKYSNFSSGLCQKAGQYKARNYYVTRYNWKSLYETDMRNKLYEGFEEKIYEYLLSLIKYQKENIVEWKTAKWFNKYSDIILETIELKGRRYKHKK